MPPAATIYWNLLTSFVPLTILIMLVLGSILGGLATPAEGGVRRRTWAITPFGRRVAAAEARRLVSLVELALERDLLNDGNLSGLSQRTQSV